MSDQPEKPAPMTVDSIRSDFQRWRGDQARYTDDPTTLGSDEWVSLWAVMKDAAEKQEVLLAEVDRLRSLLDSEEDKTEDYLEAGFDAVQEIARLRAELDESLAASADHQRAAVDLAGRLEKERKLREGAESLVREWLSVDSPEDVMCLTEMSLRAIDEEAYEHTKELKNDVDRAERAMALQVTKRAEEEEEVKRLRGLLNKAHTELNDGFGDDPPTCNCKDCEIHLTEEGEPLLDRVYGPDGARPREGPGSYHWANPPCGCEEDKNG